MLDFFDEVHDKLDFGDLSKDINSLRDKMANDSQWYALFILFITYKLFKLIQLLVTYLCRYI